MNIQAEVAKEGTAEDQAARVGITCVHYDITDLCNAGCPQCPRTDPDGCRPRDWLRKHASTLAEFRAYSPPEFLASLESAYFCGNYGDAAVVPELIEILSYCWEANPKLRLQLHTNGGMRGRDWWIRLAEAAKGRRFSVIAAIDGARQETNALYRVRTDFDRVIGNLTAFIAAGGRAEWRMLVFRHNEHEVAEAEAMAKALGFAGFRAYPSNRFDGPDFRYTFGGQEFALEPPAAKVAPKVAGRHVLSRAEVAARPVTETYIDCEAIRRGTAYLDFEGYLLPCCYFGRRLYIHHHGGAAQADKALAALFEAFDMERLNVARRGYDAARAAYEEFLNFLGPHWDRLEPKLCKSVCGRKRSVPAGEAADAKAGSGVRS